MAKCIRATDFDRVKLEVSPTGGVERSFSPEELTANQLRPGDILLEKSGGGKNQPVGKAVLFNASHRSVCSNFVERLQAAPDIFSPFLCYLFETLYSAGINTRYIKQSTGIQNLDSFGYFSDRIALPPLDEQRAIVQFLDEETATIDALVDKKLRLRTLLQERRSSAVASALTQGMDPLAPLQLTSLCWAGHIPAHWNVRRLQTVARLESGHTPNRGTKEYWDNCTIPWVSLNDVGRMQENRYITTTSNKISVAGLAHSSARMLPKDTVILSRDATVGRTAILAHPMATSQHFVNWICDSATLLPEYLYFLFLEPMQGEFRSLTMGSTLKTIGLPDVKGFAVPIPPLEEQLAIVNYCINTEASTTRMLDELNRLIDTLKEYRAALITAAVTGQIDIPGAA